MENRTRVGVVGVGYFGRYHAMHFARHPRAHLVAVADINETVASEVASEFGCSAISSHRQLIGRVDAVSIAAPTSEHFVIASELMAAGIDVLVEKPMTHDLASARALSEAAERLGRILQVGHIERFSASFRALRGLVTRPLYVESYRIAPWRTRGIEVDVVFDLMIHDIDLIQGLVRSPVTTVYAVGTSVYSAKIDLANARIAFASGCVATITASRVSHKMERSLRIFQPSSYVICDFGANRIITSSLQGDLATEGTAAVATDSFEVPSEDSLANEIDEFLECVQSRRRPTVDGQVGQDAIEIASRVNRSILEHHRMVDGNGRTD